MTLTVKSEAPPLNIDDSGVVRVAGTRVTLDTIVDAFLEGQSAEEIAESYDSVSLPDVYATVAFYLRHRAEVDAYLGTRKSESVAIRDRIKRLSDHELWRERLLTRSKAMGLRA